MLDFNLNVNGIEYKKKTHTVLRTIENMELKIPSN